MTTSTHTTNAVNRGTLEYVPFSSQASRRAPAQHRPRHRRDRHQELGNKLPPTQTSCTNGFASKSTCCSNGCALDTRRRATEVRLQQPDSTPFASGHPNSELDQSKSQSLCARGCSKSGMVYRRDIIHSAAKLAAVEKLGVAVSTAVNYSVLGNLLRPMFLPPHYWHVPVQDIIRKRVEALESMQDLTMTISNPGPRAPRMSQHATQHLICTPLDNLRSLTIPYQLISIELITKRILGHQSCIAHLLANPINILPPSLEVVCIQGYGSDRLQYRSWRDSIKFVATLVKSKSSFPRLRLVRLKFDGFTIPMAQRLRISRPGSPQVSMRIHMLRG